MSADWTIANGVLQSSLSIRTSSHN